jgi:hypothetical protein
LTAVSWLGLRLRQNELEKTIDLAVGVTQMQLYASPNLLLRFEVKNIVDEGHVQSYTGAATFRTMYPRVAAWLQILAEINAAAGIDLPPHSRRHPPG